MAQRIRLSRSRGWRKPAAAVVVSRPSRWGNPYSIVTPDLVAHPDGREWHDLHGAARFVAVERYRADLHAGRLPVTVADVVRELAGLDLACWCRLDRPCHADVLLEVANQRPPNG